MPRCDTSIVFVNADGSQAESTVARGRDFECWRCEGEGLDAFQARADSECRATNPRPPVVLVFHDEEIDRDKFLRFDPSVGNQAQKTTQHPVGDSALIPTPTKAEYERMKFTHDAQENKAFREREKAMILDMKSKIEASNKQRWN